MTKIAPQKSKQMMKWIYYGLIPMIIGVILMIISYCLNNNSILAYVAIGFAGLWIIWYIIILVWFIIEMTKEKSKNKKE